MSRHKLLASVLTILMLSVTVYQYRQMPPAKSLQTRKGTPVLVLQKTGPAQMATLFLDLQTQSQNIALKKEEISEVTVSLTALKDLPAGLQYAWTLPPGSQPMGGTPPAGSFPALVQGDSLTITLKLNGFSKEQLQYLGFSATTTALQQTIKREALYSSRLEDSMEYRVQKTHEHETQNLQKIGLNRVNKFDLSNIVK